MARSAALLGFGLDSLIELGAATAARRRLHADDPERRKQGELSAHCLIGWSFLALAIYETIDSLKALLLSERPSPSVAGSALLVLSVVVMRALARAKRRIARELASGALQSEAKQTSLCAYLSAIALVGVALNAALGWWWADPVAALVMVPIIALEGLDGVRRRDLT
jgi:divalent metal cation (Fe/Co/Zn/Cd) transporter